MQERPPSPHPSPLVRGLALLAAALCLALGIVGIFVPGLPTTVFILLAAWFAARGSPRLLAWMENHPLFGPMIRNWRTQGAVSRRAKWSATLMMGACAALLFITPAPPWAAILATGFMAAVAIWLWMRPEPLGDHSPTERRRDDASGNRT
ncbi:YbaN family protein [uncultured Pigmentiphaga sp.]|jgi:Uncharacterized protein conserved in bacteria|uniref:YbaN family protein n=1 Tax=uncultured Pigmentiphaga sp. TaxID=340361 RepID=UPI002638902C|nr:YbaN family protein [uncultured Pigmentiphaga sp.]